MNSGGTSCTAVTSTVFWAVRATIALMPWQPSRANAFRSAWIPAPPPESEAAIVRQRGTTGTRGYHRPMATHRRSLGRAPRGRGGRVLDGRPSAGASPRRAPVRPPPPTCGCASRARRRRSSTSTRSRPWKRRGAARTSSSRRAPPAGRRSPSTSRCWTRSRPTRSSGRSTSTRRRRSPRIRRGAWPSSSSRACGRRSTTATPPSEQRWQIRKWANLILTNPDMLNVGLLPHHDRWGDVLQNLRYVVVDEAHVYRGVFGSHVANVLRRLRRAAAIYGAEPQFLLASATIANPGQQARALARRRRDRGGRRRGAPGGADHRCSGTLHSSTPSSASERARSATAHGSSPSSSPTASGRSASRSPGRRPSSSTASRASASPELAGRLSPYRAGYTPSQRREIERRLVEGELLGVTATDALELGIDVGTLDCALTIGFPGTVASLRQRWGRAGRRECRARGSRRERGRARPVLHARARSLARAPGRGGDPRRHKSARPRRPRSRGRLRGADRRRETGRSSATRRWSERRCWRTQGSSRGATGATSGPDGTTRPRASRSARRPRMRSRSSTRPPAPSSASSSRSARTRRCTRERSISTSASRTG